MRGLLTRLRRRSSPLPDAGPATRLEKKSTNLGVEIGPAANHLETELLSLYWDGVRADLPPLLLTLRRHWEDQKSLKEETDGTIEGYDTFIEHVTQSAIQGKRESSLDTAAEFREALEYQGWESFARMKKERMLAGLKSSIKEQTHDDPEILRQRARLLLQSTQWLDIDKVMEHRDPPPGARLPPAQITTGSSTGGSLAGFCPQICHECSAVIRGSMFEHLADGKTVTCESCYRDMFCGKMNHTKKYRHCCLPEATPEWSSKTCHCMGVERQDENGNPRALWPIDSKVDRHHPAHNGRPGCQILEINNILAEAKYESTKFDSEKNTTLRDHVPQLIQPPSQTINRYQPPAKPSKLKKIFRNSSKPKSGSSPENLPPKPALAYNESQCKDALGWTHMALRVGPLLMENNSDGALVTLREPPNLQPGLFSPVPRRNLLLADDSQRTLFSQEKPVETKRYKGVLKQVVGGAFCGFIDSAAEDDLVDTLIAASQRLPKPDIREKPSATTGVFRRDSESEPVATDAFEWNTVVDEIMIKLREYLSPKAELYISSLASRLQDPSAKLRWARKANDSQTFCHSLLDPSLFGSFFPPSDFSEDVTGVVSPRPYLMSFFSQERDWKQVESVEERAAPNGHVEEYFIRLMKGQHEESDMIDSLMEYWYDFGACEGRLYAYQDVFPFDCTARYGKSEKCGPCSLSKHILAFPFDSWSIASLHLTRSRFFYPADPIPQKPTKRKDLYHGNPSGLMNEKEWFRNRMIVLLAQDALLKVASAMASDEKIRKAALKTLADPSRNRHKLAGIHRAQPYSHEADKGKAHRYYVADWTRLPLEQRVQEYQRIRNSRILGDGCTPGKAHLLRSNYQGSEEYVLYPALVKKMIPTHRTWADTEGNPWPVSGHRYVRRSEFVGSSGILDGSGVSNTVRGEWIDLGSWDGCVRHHTTHGHSGGHSGGGGFSGGGDSSGGGGGGDSGGGGGGGGGCD